jgi:hypothetical protein
MIFPVDSIRSISVKGILMRPEMRIAAILPALTLRRTLS